MTGFLTARHEVQAAGLCLHAKKVSVGERQFVPTGTSKRVSMLYQTREIIAYVLLGCIALALVLITATYLRRRKRALLRQRGIKHYNR